MTLTTKVKSFLRWGAISLVVFCYFLGLLVASQSFVVFSENQSLLFSNPIPLNVYNRAIDALLQATDRVFEAATYGFAICVPLIILIFKKVR